MKRSRGFSLVEVVVASSAFVVVLLIGAGALKVVKRTSEHLQGRSQPRQQLRVLLGHLQRDVRAATFLYDPHLTLDLGGGASHVFQGAPRPDEARNEMVLALAETPTTAPRYTILALFLQPDGDRAFPGSHRAVLGKVAGQVGPTPGSPADIPLASLPVGQAEVRTFATASPADGLRIRQTPSGDGLRFEFVIGHRLEGEGLHWETYQSTLTMRNNR